MDIHNVRLNHETNYIRAQINKDWYRDTEGNMRRYASNKIQNVCKGKAVQESKRARRLEGTHRSDTG